MAYMNDSEPYEMLDIPGHEGFQVLVVSRSTSHSSYNEEGSKSPWWGISMKCEGKEILTSTVVGEEGKGKGSRDAKLEYKNFAELYGFHISAFRYTLSDQANQLYTSSMIMHEDVVVVLPNAGYAATIENAMNVGNLMDEIYLICYGWFKGKLDISQSIKFENAYIITLTHDLDRIIVRFRAHRKNYTYYAWKQDGTADGQSVCELDLEKNTSKMEAKK